MPVAVVERLFLEGRAVEKPAEPVMSGNFSQPAPLEKCHAVSVFERVAPAPPMKLAHNSTNSE